MIMTKQEIHVSAFDIRREIFELVNRIKSLQAIANRYDSKEMTEQEFDERLEMAGELDSAACSLATFHDELPDVFVAAARDN